MINKWLDISPNFEIYEEFKEKLRIIGKNSLPLQPIIIYKV